MENNRKTRFIINIIYFSIIVALGYIIFRFLLNYFIPFIIAGIVAWLSQKPSCYISMKIKIKQKLCAGIISVILFSLILSAAFLILYFSITTASTFFSGLSGNINNIVALLNKIRDNFNELIKAAPKNLSSIIESVYNSLYNKIIGVFPSAFELLAGIAVKRAPSFLLSCIVSVVASFYLAVDFNGLVKFFRSMCPKRTYNIITKVKRIFTESILCLIRGYAILMLLTFIELSIGFAIIKIKYAIFLAFLISVIDILPILGTGTVLIPWGVITIILGNSKEGISLLIIYVIITIIRNFAEPKVISRQTGINPLFTLISMFVGMKLSGIAGMMLFPIAFIVIIKYYKEELHPSSTI